MLNGFIQFAVLGGKEAKGGVLGASDDENSIILRKGEQSDMGEKIKDYIENRIIELSKPQVATVIQQQTSSADELIKYKSLLDSGVISQEEFDAKKKQILGI